MPTNLPGEYYLQGMREMASGFLLNPDRTFQFFFTYGALDRNGAGVWGEKNGQVIFSSHSKPADGYVLVNSTKKEQEFISIRLEGNNPMANAYTSVSLQQGDEGSWQQMDQGGDVQFPLQEIKTISLLFEFCPEKLTTVTVPAGDHNDFTFRMQPSIIEVLFDNFSLQVEPDTLSGGHPLMEGNEFTYTKQ